MSIRKLLFPFLLILAVSGLADAETVKLKLVNVNPGYNDGHYYVYPYNFSINDSATLFAMLCDDFKDDVSVGEVWMANVFTLEEIFSGQGQMTPYGGLVADGDRVSAYKEAAWLYEELEEHLDGSNAVSINHTIWSLFAPTPFAGDADVAGWHSAAGAATSGLSNQQAVELFADVRFFTPIAGSQSGNLGRPQEFIASTSVPEASSIILLGTALIALCMMRRH